MKNPILFLLLFSCFCQLHAQPPGLSQVNMTSLSKIGPNSAVYVVSTDPRAPEGSRFKNGDWQEARIRLRGVETFSEIVEVLLDLDNHSFYFRFKDQPKRVGQIAPNEISALLMFQAKDSVYYEVHNLNQIAHDGPNGPKFYEIMYAGDMILLHLEDKFLRKEEYVENLGMVRRPDVYKSTHKYFLIRNKRLHEVKKNIKGIQKVLPDKASQVKSIVKRKRLKISNNDDLATLFAELDKKREGLR